MVRLFTIYLDDCKYSYGRMKMSHLFIIPSGPDADHELDLFAERIGLKRKWKHNDHYDLCQSRRQVAIDNGAVPVTAMEGARIRQRDRRLSWAQASSYKAAERSIEQSWEMDDG